MRLLDLATLAGEAPHHQHKRWELSARVNAAVDHGEEHLLQRLFCLMSGVKFSSRTETIMPTVAAEALMSRFDPLLRIHLPQLPVWAGRLQVLESILAFCDEEYLYVNRHPNRTVGVWLDTLEDVLTVLADIHQARTRNAARVCMMDLLTCHSEARHSVADVVARLSETNEELRQLLLQALAAKQVRRLAQRPVRDIPAVLDGWNPAVRFRDYYLHSMNMTSFDIDLEIARRRHQLQVITCRVRLEDRQAEVEWP